MIEKLSYGPSKTNNKSGVAATAFFVLAGPLLVWSSYIHFHLWHKLGYRHIPTIGPLFLLQSIAALVSGVLLVVVRRVWIAILGAGVAMSTAIGFLISVEVGLFGFKDSWAAPFAHQAFFIESSATVCTIIAGALCLLRSRRATEHRHPSADLPTWSS